MGPLRSTSLPIALAAVLLLPGAAAAAAPTVPPDLSATAQYTETLPGARGDEPTRGDGVGRTPAQAIGAEPAARLEAGGADGRAAALLAAQTAPVGRSAPANKESAGDRGNPAGTAAARSRSNPAGASPLSQLLGQLSGAGDSDGMGALLPLLMIAVLVGSLVYLLRRLQRAAR